MFSDFKLANPNFSSAKSLTHAFQKPLLFTKLTWQVFSARALVTGFKSQGGDRTRTIHLITMKSQKKLPLYFSRASVTATTILRVCVCVRECGWNI